MILPETDVIHVVDLPPGPSIMSIFREKQILDGAQLGRQGRRMIFAGTTTITPPSDMSCRIWSCRDYLGMTAIDGDLNRSMQHIRQNGPLTGPFLFLFHTAGARQGVPFLVLAPHFGRSYFGVTVCVRAWSSAMGLPSIAWTRRSTSESKLPIVKRYSCSDVDRSILDRTP